MSAEVIQLDEMRPHSSGEVLCLACANEWVAVTPVGTVWLDCPACKLTRGRYKYAHTREGAHWQCKCGNDLFSVMEQGIYCPNCGGWQVFPNARDA